MQGPWVQSLVGELRSRVLPEVSRREGLLLFTLLLFLSLWSQRLLSEWPGMTAPPETYKTSISRGPLAAPCAERLASLCEQPRPSDSGGRGVWEGPFLGSARVSEHGPWWGFLHASQNGLSLHSQGGRSKHTHESCFCLYFGFGYGACGVLAPWPGMEPTPPALEGKVLNSRVLPGTSQEVPSSACFDGH